MKKSLLTAAFTSLIGLSLLGCSPKETIVEVDTPAGGVSVERDIITDEVSVDVNK